jgi:uncharacterized protein YutE (UPF0331/DUF86 family)
MPIEPDDVSLNKAAIIERCIRRIGEEYAANPELDDCTRVDALTLNIERACQACIDLAMHLVAVRHLGMPQASGDAFRLLEQGGLLSSEVAKSMRNMTGFRNVAIHQYQELNVDILRTIAAEKWRDWHRFCQELNLSISPSP